MPASPLQLSVDQQSMANVAKAMRSEADGKELRKQLLRALKAEAAPVVTALKASINSAPSQGLSAGGSLRTAVAASVKPVVRLSGKATGVAIRQTGTPNLRGFNLAGRRFNDRSFRRRVYGKAWVTQTGAPRWFDNEAAKHREEFRRDVLAAVQAVADVLAQRAEQ